MRRLKQFTRAMIAGHRAEEGHAAAWGGGGLLTIVLVVLLIILIF